MIDKCLRYIRKSIYSVLPNYIHHYHHSLVSIQKTFKGKLLRSEYIPKTPCWWQKDLQPWLDCEQVQHDDHVSASLSKEPHANWRPDSSQIHQLQGKTTFDKPVCRHWWYQWLDRQHWLGPWQFYQEGAQAIQVNIHSDCQDMSEPKTQTICYFVILNPVK